MKVGRIAQLTHTPGPWKVSTLNGRTIGPERGLTAHGTTVTQLQAVARITERGAESEANARLVAAAPELLAALTRIANNTAECGCDHTTIECCAKTRDVFCARCIAAAAIAKAEGRES